jgi:hypothetical protein
VRILSGREVMPRRDFRSGSNKYSHLDEIRRDFCRKNTLEVRTIPLNSLTLQKPKKKFFFAQIVKASMGT